jgi:hypothetical protein
LGKPFEIQDEAEQEVYIYRFLLETPHIEEGYEDRALNEVKITFDKKTQELIKMAGRFAGLKVSINYKSFLMSRCRHRQTKSGRSAARPTAVFIFPACRPHSFCAPASHHQRPALSCSLGRIARVQGSQPMLV